MSFSFSLKKSSATKPAAGTGEAPAGTVRAPLAVFQEALEAEALEAEQEQQKPSRLSLSHFSRPAGKIDKEKVEKLLQQDPQALSYDEVYDQVSCNAAKEQQQRSHAHYTYLGYTEDIKDKIAKDNLVADTLAAEAAAAAKATGASTSPLGTSPGAPGGASGAPQARYIGKFVVKAQRRQVEKEIIKERQMKKEREREGAVPEEVFVTSAYKARLEERRKIMEELERQDERDRQSAADKQKDLSSFHSYLLKSGASTRSAVGASPAASAAAGAAATAAAAAARASAGHRQPEAAGAAAPAAKSGQVKTSPAALKAESPAAASHSQSPQQQQQQNKEEKTSVKAEPANDVHSSPATPSGSSSSSRRTPITEDMVLPFKRSAGPKTLPVPDKLSPADIAGARARYLQLKKLKTEAK